jgi:hypothetical protein
VQPIQLPPRRRIVTQISLQEFTTKQDQKFLQALEDAKDAISAYDDLYKNPRTGEYIIDGDEAQVAADLVKALKGLTPTYALIAGDGSNVLAAGFNSLLDAQQWAGKHYPAGTDLGIARFSA